MAEEWWSTTFTRVWLGYVGLAAVLASKQVLLTGSARAIATAGRLLVLTQEPMLKAFRFSAFPSSAAIPTKRIGAKAKTRFLSACPSAE